MPHQAETEARRFRSAKGQKQKQRPEGRRFARLFAFGFGAVEKTRTSTPCGTATSTLRVYQFRHDRETQAGVDRREVGCSK
jgi:ribosomal protein L32E